MSKQGLGVFFIGVSACLYISKYLSAAIFGSNLKSWDEDMFQAMLSYIGPNLTFWSTASLIVGLIYLVLGEIESKKKK
ncbi:hypothetical protein MOB66_09040 [Bacillus haynesii]|uniref:hypothetical protein n=1 Tax=Bacillus haynesii TaxID=1925021 RepID=UPI00228313E7|nr:hypothetical protein [Bacillus haynesii]MCY7772042.1 hypothetical protein [Bacillus haynesii]MCY8012576.1 hypothetical protein [Bacillus haynesii]MEC0761377.1 hypothetical protein [Bacillus haynesii]MEC0783765.1 hypothetical protein [Bacillus haynesii]